MGEGGGTRHEAGEAGRVEPSTGCAGYGSFPGHKEWLRDGKSADWRSGF